MKVLLILAHPREESLSGALLQSYKRGAVESGHQVEQLNLGSMQFERDVLHHSPKAQELEKKILESQELISWADHLVFVYPTWWGTFPAVLKSFFDRVLTEGYAFEEIEGGTGYKKLFRNKSAEIFTTMDTPKFIYKYLYKSPGHKAVGLATLNFCGISPVEYHIYGPVRNSEKKTREKWIDETHAKALSLNMKSRRYERSRKISAWLKAVRLQFYPMTTLAFLLGALLASYFGNNFSYLIFILSISWVFFLEVATVLINEKYDLESDKQNEYFSPFTGGSRVIVDELLSLRQINKGIAFSMSLAALFSVALIIFSASPALPTILVLLISTILALGYTAPPFKLSYRGLAALDVGFTHSFGVLVAGFVFQGGQWNNPVVWLLGIPLFLSILPSIILAGIPDKKADAAVGKKTVAVRFGSKNAARAAMVSVILSIISLLVVFLVETISEVYSFFIFLSVSHSILLIVRLKQYISTPNPKNRIDNLIVLSLTYMLWFVIVPIISLLLR